MQFLGLFIELCGKWKWWFKLQNPSHEICGEKIYMQGMRVLSESEGISFQTPILKITKFIWRWKSKIKKYLAKILPKISFVFFKMTNYLYFQGSQNWRKKLFHFPPFFSNIYTHSYNSMVFAEIRLDNTKKQLLFKYPHRLCNMRGFSKSERITCQTSILTILFL